MKDKLDRMTLILDEKYGAIKRKLIMEGNEVVYGNDPVSCAEWVKGFMEFLHKELDLDLQEVLGSYCPCIVGDEVILKAKSIKNSSSNVQDFVEQMDKNNVIGKKIWYNSDDNTIYLTKKYACECGGGFREGSSLIAKRCHCCMVYASKEHLSIDYCYCGAKFYYPLFSALFGDEIVVEPVETVLSGGTECIFAVRLP